MKETLKSLRYSLRPLYGDKETEAIIRLIFHYLKGWNLTDMLIHAEEPLSPFIKQEIRNIERRLLNNEPIQYITGTARFHGMDFVVRPGVLIPRQETDELTDIIISDNKEKSDLNILDLCTGSGCIAVTLAKNLRFPVVDALDNSTVAKEITSKNACNLKCNINFILDDIFRWQPEKSYDIMVSNPPYVDESEAETMHKNVLDYEPKEAIFVSDSEPLVFYSRIAELAISNLKNSGTLYLEINPRHVSELKDIFAQTGFSSINVLCDSSRKERFMICKKPD